MITKSEFDDAARDGLVVTLPSGSAELLPTQEAERREVPQRQSIQFLKQWIVRYKGNFSKYRVDFLQALVDDSRMREFWDWLENTPFTCAPILCSSVSVGEAIHRATRLPNFPGNITPAQRAAYFDKVRKHSRALMELLRGTKFDRTDMRELSEEELEAPLAKKLWNWGDDEDDSGHIVAFAVTPDGEYEMPYDYPRSSLTETLAELHEWTHWEDQWDGNFLASSAPIAQANSSSTRVIYFTCSLHDWIKRQGAEIPFPILATVANVALNLGADEQIDEEAVRKQVRRYQARRTKSESEHQNAFDNDAGQNLEKLDDSVLSDPF